MGNIELVHPDDLNFDYENPRIAEFNIDYGADERRIIKVLWDTMGVEEIALSIRASGFFVHEPLIAVRENGKNIVIEGNRRLAAIKCLINPDLARRVGINLNNLQLSQEFKEGLNRIPVLFADQRVDAWKFIGFKHINGPAKWGSYAKAQYISQIKREYGIELEEIAKQIGDTHKTVQKLYQGLQVVEQAEEAGRFDRGDITGSRLYFSHLYTGLTYDGYRNYLGITGVPESQERPVPAEKLDNLGEVLTWLFGSKSKGLEPVIQSQNPDVRRLDSVLKSREAIVTLRKTNSLYEAYEVSQPKEETFEQYLLEAKRSLQKAQSFATEGFDGHNVNLLRLAGATAEIAEELYKGMEAKWVSLNEQPDKKTRRFS